jgi:hypothetical protein
MLRIYNNKAEYLYIISRYNANISADQPETCMSSTYSWLGMASHLQQLQFCSKKVWWAGPDMIIQKYSEGDISGHLSDMFSCSSYIF